MSHEVQFDGSLTVIEKNAVERHQEMFVAAYTQGLYFTAFVDERRHRYIDVRCLADRRKGIGRFKLEDLSKTSPELRTDIACGRHPFVEQ